MTRLDHLRTKRAASSYGAPLTLFERLELARLEAEMDDRRHGRIASADASGHEPTMSRGVVTYSMFED